MSPCLEILLTSSTDVPIANVIHVKLYCDQCERLGLQAECRHMRKFMPPWKDPTKFELSYIICGDEHKSIFLQESMGISIHVFLFFISYVSPRGCG